MTPTPNEAQRVDLDALDKLYRDAHDEPHRNSMLDLRGALVENYLPLAAELRELRRGAEELRALRNECEVARAVLALGSDDFGIHSELVPPIGRLLIARNATDALRADAASQTNRRT